MISTSRTCGMPMIVFFCCAVLLCRAAANDELQVLIVEDAEKAPKRGGELVEQAAKALPEGYKIKITIGQFFDTGHSSSTEQFEPFVDSVVYLNEDGKEDGEQKYFTHASSRPVRTVAWKDGIKDGPERIYKMHPYYVETELPWVKGVLQGARKTFHPDGSVKSETPYTDGKPNGTTKSFSPDGKLTRECTLKNGQRDGTLTDYWPETGKPRRVIDYKNGKVVGDVRQYYVNGQLKSQVSFHNDAMHGEEKLFERDGKPQKSRYWFHGALVTKTEFEVKTKP